MPFIIYGTRGITSTRDSGRFHCPQCGPSHYALKGVRRFFTLYWIPLIPLDSLGEFVECDECSNTFDPAVLDYNPEATIKEFEQAARRLMARMVLADGEVGDDEIATMVAVSEMLPGTPLTEASARLVVDRERESGQDLMTVVRGIRNELNDKGKRMLLEVALAIATADGEFDDSEKVRFLEIGEALGLSGEDVLAVVRSEAA